MEGFPHFYNLIFVHYYAVNFTHTCTYPNVHTCADQVSCRFYIFDKLESWQKPQWLDDFFDISTNFMSKSFLKRYNSNLDFTFQDHFSKL